MLIKFYPYDFAYKTVQDKTYIYLYSKLEDGTKACIIHNYQPYFYAIGDIPKLTIPTPKRPAKILDIEPVEKELLGKTIKLNKITVNYPKAVPILAKELAARGIQCYEKDILYTHRTLRDLRIIPLTINQAEGEFIETKLRIPTFEAKSIQDAGKEAQKQWNILAIDIETYAKKKEINPQINPILMVSFYGIKDQQIFRKVITWKKFPHELDYLETVSDEAELIKRCKEIILSWQPDIITGYFSDGFDFPYLNTRAEKHKVPFDLGLDYSDLRIRRSANRSDVKIQGILHIDIFKFIKYIQGQNLKTDSYSLDSVSAELLGSKKHKVNLDNLAKTWDDEPQKLVDYCEYNLHDSHLTFQLTEKLMPDIIEFSKIIGVPTFDIIRMRFSKLVENYIMRRAIEFNVLAPNKASNDEVSQRMEEHIQGAFVYQPIPGLYKDVIIFDFRSLYPTIITAHNIGPEALHCKCCRDLGRVPERKTLWFCTKDHKFLPSVLQQIVLRRVDLKRLIKEQQEKGENTKLLEARSYALKILANSFYGYLGFYAARWYSLESAAATTAYARNYIKTTIEKAKNKGFEVCYGDTDSMFLLLGEKHLDQAMEFMNEINFDLPGHMELEYEGYFPRGIFVSTKGSAKGAKKKYALIDKNDKLKITGFAAVRRNVSILAKEIQTKVLQFILQDQKEQAIDYVQEQIKKLKAGKTPLDKLIITTQITRELSQYASVGPHVVVARKLAARGEIINPGTMVQYVIAKGSGLVRDRATIKDEVEEYDSEYYLKNQLLPAIQQIFEVLNVNEDELLGKGKQTGLGSFF